MSVFAKSEIDVLRESIRKAVLVPAEDQLTLDLVDTQETALPREQMKLAIKVWTAMSKFIRSQCNKGKIVDTFNFGTFAKASSLKSDVAEGENYYVYCTGPNSPFQLVENAQNIPDIAPSVLEDKLV